MSRIHQAYALHSVQWPEEKERAHYSPGQVSALNFDLLSISSQFPQVYFPGFVIDKVAFCFILVVIESAMGGEKEKDCSSIATEPSYAEAHKGSPLISTKRKT